MFSSRCTISYLTVTVTISTGLFHLNILYSYWYQDCFNHMDLIVLMMFQTPLEASSVDLKHIFFSKAFRTLQIPTPIYIFHLILQAGSLWHMYN